MLRRLSKKLAGFALLTALPAAPVAWLVHEAPATVAPSRVRPPLTGSSSPAAILSPRPVLAPVASAAAALPSRPAPGRPITGTGSGWSGARAEP